MDIIRGNKQVFKSQIRKAVGEDASAEDVLNYIFHDEFDEFDSESNDFVIRQWYSANNSALHRFNMIWAVVLTIIVSPYQYVAKGYVGWDTKTVFGRWILKVTGNLKD